MTNAHTSGEMPDNPGDPAVTDPEADAAVNNAGEAPGESPEAAVKAQEDAQRDAAEAAADDAAADLADGDDTVDPSLDPEAAANPAEAELAERTEDLKRVTAEYANYRRRAERDREAAVEAAKAGLATDLLPILDDLDLAAEHGDLTGPLKAMSDKLNTVLRGAKVEVVGAEGDAFDPELHEAVQDMSSGDEKAVGTVLRKGYRMGERVLRHAMVVIADPQ
ncbi:nucleotide exchange factor GrpE [Corynebacterium sp.]|uniref:nucleotide exchange factor GrpE n=1 Tax=Corynebacterium sp. TaxID=1720 RepID=UPI0026330638|nr:nucleotide exchange factor GrpE [Corynebacterium sp.]